MARLTVPGLEVSECPSSNITASDPLPARLKNLHKYDQV